VIGMPHTTAHVDGRIAPHVLPIPLGRPRVQTQYASVLAVGQAVRMLCTYVDTGAPISVQFLAHMRFAGTALDRLVDENELVIDGRVRGGDEEPLALSDEDIGFAAQPLAAFALSAAFLVANGVRLERLLGGHHGADRSALGNGGDEPMPLVMSAQELVVRAGRMPHHKQQVPILGLQVKHLEVGIAIGLDVEEFATPVMADIDDHRTGWAKPSIPHQGTDRDARAKLLEFGLNVCRIHTGLDTHMPAQVRDIGGSVFQTDRNPAHRATPRCGRPQEAIALLNKTSTDEAWTQLVKAVVVLAASSNTMQSLALIENLPEDMDEQLYPLALAVACLGKHDVRDIESRWSARIRHFRTDGIRASFTWIASRFYFDSQNDA